MGTKTKIFQAITGLFPEKYINGLRQQLIYADYDNDVSDWVGISLICSILVMIIGIIVASFFNVHPIIIFVGAIAIPLFGQFAVYLIFYFNVGSRTSKIEVALPDVLQLIASNLQAGMTPFDAIRVSARKEFGPLEKEFKTATTRAMGNRNFGKELLAISERVNSSMFNRAMKLITSSLSSGGHLATLLEELSEDIAETQSMKNEMVTNTKTYSMFIMFTIIVGAPLLLAISINFVGMVQDMQESVSLSTDEFGLGFLSGEIDITPQFLTKMSIVTLFVTSLLASMLTGTISDGEATAGLKFAPAVIAASLICFVIAKMIIGNFFAGM